MNIEPLNGYGAGLYNPVTNQPITKLIGEIDLLPEDLQILPGVVLTPKQSRQVAIWIRLQAARFVRMAAPRTAKQVQVVWDTQMMGTDWSTWEGDVFKVALNPNRLVNITSDPDTAASACIGAAAHEVAHGLYTPTTWPDDIKAAAAAYPQYPALNNFIIEIFRSMEDLYINQAIMRNYLRGVRNCISDAYMQQSLTSMASALGSPIQNISVTFAALYASVTGYTARIRDDVYDDYYVKCEPYITALHNNVMPWHTRLDAYRDLALILFTDEELEAPQPKDLGEPADGEDEGTGEAPQDEEQPPPKGQGSPVPTNHPCAGDIKPSSNPSDDNVAPFSIDDLKEINATSTYHEISLTTGTTSPVTNPDIIPLPKTAEVQRLRDAMRAKGDARRKIVKGLPKGKLSRSHVGRLRTSEYIFQKRPVTRSEAAEFTLLVDGSGSMSMQRGGGKTVWQIAAETSATMYAALLHNPDYLVEEFVYDSRGFGSQFSIYPTRLERGRLLRAPQPGGGTPTVSAVMWAYHRMKKRNPTARRVIICLTDLDTTYGGRPDDLAEVLEDENSTIILVHINTGTQPPPISEELEKALNARYVQHSSLVKHIRSIFQKHA